MFCDNSKTLYLLGVSCNGELEVFPRLVGKDGYCQVQMKNVPFKKSLIQDIFTTAVEMSWR
jgi:hypothetical protein